MRRRTVLAATTLLGSGALAGCSLLGPSERTTLRLRETATLGASPASELRDDRERLVREAAANGSATAYGYEPFESERTHVLADGTYYRVTAEDAGTGDAERPVLVVEPVENATDAVPLERYDGHAVEMIDPLLGEEGGTRPLRPNDPGTDALLPSPTYENVTRQGETYRLRVEQRTVESRAYRVTVEAVADEEAAYGSYVREELAATLDPATLPDGARKVLAEAVEDAYTESDPYSDAFRAVLEAAREGARVDGEASRSHLVVYDDTVYRADVEVVVSEM
jgi:hypothetical protein